MSTKLIQIKEKEVRKLTTLVEGSLSLCVVHLRAVGSHGACFPLLPDRSKFLLLHLEQGSAGFASSLARCLPKKAHGFQENDLQKQLDGPAAAKGEKKIVSLL